MQPSLMSQMTNSMANGQGEMGVQTPGSPMFQQALQTPAATPNPDRAAGLTSHLHNALRRRGISPEAIPQLNGGQPAPQDPSSAPQAPSSGQPGIGQPAQQPTIPVSETELILRAMEKHMTHKDKLQMKVVEAALPQEAQAPQQ
jgi:hypothetical protein